VKNILLIGNSARTHVIAETLSRSPQQPMLHGYMATQNPGITKLSTSTHIGNITDTVAIVQYAQKVKADFAIIGPETPLEAGVVDALEIVGITSIGPKKILAQLETSKSFTRDLLTKYNIPGNPKFRVFSSTEKLRFFMESLGEYVVKADGLRGGKGVKLSGEHLKTIEDAVAYCVACIEKDGKVVVEEKFVGQEFSLMSFVDGKTVVDMPAAQDHKRAGEGDSGDNTGGMGSYSDTNHELPFLHKKDIQAAHSITKQVAAALEKETGVQYKGVMYGGFITTNDGVKLVEYNARFGDPEAMNVLPLLKTDFVMLCEAIIHGTLDQVNVMFENKATVCKYVVPTGYPHNPVREESIVLPHNSNARMYFAGVHKDEMSESFVMSGSRAVAFVGIADTLREAEQYAEQGAQLVKGKVFYRKDIGTTALIQKRIEQMKMLRE
jgi:phosphoribosylamine---glycine ligase